MNAAQDSHWSPAGMERAASAVADRILARGWLTRGNVSYDRRPEPVRRPGNVVVERDLRLGTEGWQFITIGVPLPPNATPPPTARRFG